MERLVLPVLNGNGQMSTVPAHVTVTGGCEVALNEADRLADVMRDGFQRFDIGAGIVVGQPWTDRGGRSGARSGARSGEGAWWLSHATSGDATTRLATT